MLLHLYWKECIFIAATFFTFAEALIGFKFYQIEGSKCGMSLYRLNNTTETQWIQLDTHYPFPCYEVMKHPNHVHFTLATNSDGNVFITVIFADMASKKYYVAYLVPVLNEFTPFKEIIANNANCFHQNSSITGLLNFNKGGKDAGKIRISNPSPCDVKFSEADFFSKNKTTLGILKPVRGRPQVSMDDNEATNLIYQTIQQNPKELDHVILYSDHVYSPFVLPFNVSKPAMFISGKYVIYKNVEYNIPPINEKYTYVMMNLGNPQPWGNITTTFEWPNYVYIFDETYFKKSLYLPCPGVQDNFATSSTTVSNGNEILKLPLMLTLVAALRAVNSY